MSSSVASNDLNVSLNDWVKNRVLAVRRVNPMRLTSSQQQQRYHSATLTHSYRQQQQQQQKKSQHDQDDVDELGGMMEMDMESSGGGGGGQLFVDYLPATIENINGTLVTVTFTHVASASNAASATSSDDIASSSSLVLSQSLPANLSMLPFQQRYSFSLFLSFLLVCLMSLLN